MTDDCMCETAKETQMYRTVFWTLWEKARVGWFERLALKHVYYHMWNRSPVQVRCMKQGTQRWWTGTTLRDGIGREVGRGFSMLDTYTLMADSCQFSCSDVSDSLWPHESQHARPPCPSQTPGVHSNACPLSRWCHPTISSSVVPFSSCPQSLPASGSFPVSQLFAWGGPLNHAPSMWILILMQLELISLPSEHLVYFICIIHIVLPFWIVNWKIIMG